MDNETCASGQMVYKSDTSSNRPRLSPGKGKHVFRN